MTTALAKKIDDHAVAWRYDQAIAATLEKEICSSVQSGEVYHRMDGVHAVVLTTVRKAGSVGRDAFQIAYEVDGDNELHTMPLMDFLELPWVASPSLVPR